MNDEFKDLTIEELARGYTVDDDGDGYRCIFCGEHFERNLIYISREKQVTAERAVFEHIFDIHGGSFAYLITLDKQLSGVSDTQKNLLNLMFEEKDNKIISDEMNINTATVRTHKFNLQKTKREAKIFLALLEQIENENLVKARKKCMKDQAEIHEDLSLLSNEFNGNTLHPFFTQCKFK